MQNSLTGAEKLGQVTSTADINKWEECLTGETIEYLMQFLYAIDIDKSTSIGCG